MLRHDYSFVWCSTARQHNEDCGATYEKESDTYYRQNEEVALLLHNTDELQGEVSTFDEKERTGI